MITSLIDYALMAGASYISNRPAINQIPAPDVWQENIQARTTKDSGFEATYFTNGTELVISFAGTDFSDGLISLFQSDFWSGNIPLISGASVNGADQLVDAVEYYLQVKNDPANAGKIISLTGHSLGGALASLVGVFFGEGATTFDQVPAAATAGNSQAISLYNELLNRGHTVDELAPFAAYIAATDPLNANPNPADTFAARAARIDDIYVNGEVASIIPLAQRIGSDASLSVGSNGVGASDLHSIALLTAMQQSGDTAATAPTDHTLGQATVKLPDLLKMIFDKNLFAHGTGPSSDKVNFLERLVQHQAGIYDPVTGAVTLTPDQMVTRFTADLWKIAQDGGMTMPGNATDMLPDGTLLQPIRGALSKALTVFAMQKYYEENLPAGTVPTELFTDLATAGGSNGIRFDITDTRVGLLGQLQSGKGMDFAATDPSTGQYLLKGYQYFQQFLNSSLFTVEERTLIKYILPALRDWYVQTGANGMTATDTLNRGAFMLGGNGQDTLTGGTKADLLVGNAGDDILNGGQGNDTLLGGAGNDTYVYTTGDGLDTILDTGGQNILEVDTAELAGGNQYGDSRVHRSADGKHLYVDAGQGNLIIDGNILIQNYGTGGSFGLTMSGPTPEAAPQMTLTGTANDDDIDLGTANTANDIIDAGAGQDFVFAGQGNDIVLGGAGSDALDGSGGNDHLYAEGFISVADAIALGNTQSGTGMQGDALSGDSGDDTLIGGNGNDILAGGAGNDLLIAGAGDDYIFGDTDWAAGSGRNWGVVNNILVGGAGGIANWSGDITRDVIYAGAGDDQVWGELGNDVIFGEGGADMLVGGSGNDVILGGSDNDIIYGDRAESASFTATPGNDYLDGGAGDDVIYGDEGDDILIGGADNDTLVGGTGQDTYIYNLGDGKDWIYDTMGERNILRFGAGVNSNNITLNLGSLKLNLGNGGEIHIAGFNQNDVFNSSSISSFEFDDGTILTANELLARGFDLEGTGNNDTLTGTNTTDRISGLGGDDQIFGMAGNDTLNGGDGNDQLIGDDGAGIFSGDDVLNGEAGDDLLWGNGGNDILSGGIGNDILQGESGNDVLFGGDGNDKLAGGVGDDYLDGGMGDDIYYYNLGDGIDHIVDSGGANDWLVLGNGATMANLRLDTGSLKMVFSDGSELHLDDFDPNNPLAGSIEFIQFSDGQAMSREQMIQTLGFNIQGAMDGSDSNLSGTALGETITTYAGNDTVTALGGNDIVKLGAGNDWADAGDGHDTVQGEDGDDTVLGGNGTDNLDGGAGNDVLDGGAGVDTLIGGAGNDTLDGGIGNDSLNGGTGNDTYLFERGDGQDTIQETASINGDASDVDTIRFGTGIFASDIVFGSNGMDLVLGIKGSDEQITVMGWGQDPAFRIERIEFADGMVWDEAALKTMVEVATDQADILHGTDGNDNMRGLGGDDILYGLSGDDILAGDLGNDMLFGGDGNDTLDGGGGRGNDILDGGAGNDTYLFDIYGGQDILQDYDTTAGNVDRVQLGFWQSPWGTTVQKVGQDLKLIVNNPLPNGGSTTDTLTLKNWYVGSAYVIEQVVFADGTVWDAKTLAAKATPASSLDDVIYGSSENDSLNGLTGNDIIHAGDGNDLVDGGLGGDSLFGGAGDDIYIVDNILDTVTEYFNEGFDSVQSSVTFALGADIENLTLTGTTAIDGTGNDLENVLIGNSARNTLIGYAGNDWLDGGAGVDTMMGGLGDDTYVADSTRDDVVENAGEGVDTVMSSVKYALSDNVENLILTGAASVNGTGNALDNLLVGNAADNDLVGNGGNDILQGGAGNDVLKDSAGNTLMDGGAGSDVFVGNAGNELFIGGTGNDKITTGTGADIIAFNRGDGQDTVVASTGLDNTISLGGGIGYQDLSLSKVGNDLILDAGGGDQIILDNWYKGRNGANHSVANLQLVLDATAYDAASSEPLLNRRVQEFNFDTLVQVFDQAMATSPTMASWALTNSLLSAHLAGSDTDALGGDLAYQYNLSGTLSGIGLSSAQAVISDANFGAVRQQLQPLAGLRNDAITLS